MDRRTFIKALSAYTMLGATATGYAQDQKPAQTTELKPISLPKPEKDGGKSVLASIAERRTNRNVSSEKLSDQTLSNLLWAAFGVNREAGPGGKPGRTAASASNSQEVDIYVLLPDGAYLYEAIPHRLTPVAAGDLRGLAGGRGGRGGPAANAPVNFIYVADLAKYGNATFQEPGLRDSDIQKSYYYVATGLIAGNVYLFAASQGLAAWFHNCNKPALTEALKLRSDQRALFGQTVGKPA